MSKRHMARLPSESKCHVTGSTAKITGRISLIHFNTIPTAKPVHIRAPATARARAALAQGHGNLRSSNYHSDEQPLTRPSPMGKSCTATSYTDFRRFAPLNHHGRRQQITALNKRGLDARNPVSRLAYTTNYSRMRASAFSKILS